MSSFTVGHMTLFLGDAAAQARGGDRGLINILLLQRVDP